MKPTPNSAHPLLIRRRRWTAMLALPFALLVAAGGLWLAIVAYVSFDGGLGIVVVTICLAGFLGACSVAWHSWQGVSRKDPVLVLDADGITDDFHHNMFLSWTDIQSATIHYGDGDSLVIKLREGALLPNGKVVQRSFTRMAKRAFNGGDLVIPLGSLSVDYGKLKRSLQYYVARPARD